MRSRDRSLMERIKAYVEEYALENAGATPSNRDIGEKFAMSRVSAYRYLKSMDELGMIQYEDGRIRTERIDKIEPVKDLSPSYLGSIPAGPADEVDALVDEYVSIPSVFVDNQRGKFYILKVNGESMKDAGIDSGDLVIIRNDQYAKPGDIVAALVQGNSSTLKRYRQDEAGPYLWAENESWSEDKRFYGRVFQIQGIAVKVVKNLV